VKKPFAKKIDIFRTAFRARCLDLKQAITISWMKIVLLEWTQVLFISLKVEPNLFFGGTVAFLKYRFIDKTRQ